MEESDGKLDEELLGKLREGYPEFLKKILHVPADDSQLISWDTLVSNSDFFAFLVTDSSKNKTIFSDASNSCRKSPQITGQNSYFLFVFPYLQAQSDAMQCFALTDTQFSNLRVHVDRSAHCMFERESLCLCLCLSHVISSSGS